MPDDPCHHVAAARGSFGALGNFRFPTTDDLNWNAGMTQHGNQGIDTETIDLASDKVADPWLSHFKEACGLSLREPPRFNQLAEPNHQVCPNLEILGFLLRKPEVAKYIAGRSSNFDRHGTSFFFWPRSRRKLARRLRANAMSASLVWAVRFSNAWMT